MLETGDLEAAATSVGMEHLMHQARRVVDERPRCFQLPFFRIRITMQASRFLCISVCCALLAAPGCGGPAAVPPQAERPETRPNREATARPTAESAQEPPAPKIVPVEIAADGQDRAGSERLESPPPSFTEAMSQPVASKPPAPEPEQIDEQRVQTLGIRKLSSKHLTLYTDLPLDDEIRSLPEAFDQAYPQWRDYFHLTAPENMSPRAIGRLMMDDSKFRAAGLLPDDLPAFVNGYSRGAELWWREQPSAYYRRHLMLHEGTHAFMFGTFGTCGPPWYMEGIAELLATHSWTDGKLKLNVFPSSREGFPYWGRVKIVRDSVVEGTARRLEEVLAFAPGLHSTVEPYGWCWATAAFLDGHPRYQQRFRQLPAELNNDEFNRRMKALYADDWSDLNEEWQCYILDLDYGYDLVRNAIEFTPGKPLPADGARVTISADRGWQSTGIRLEAGKRYSIRASGRYQLGQQPQTWWSEPNGVSLRYYGGRPLGVLMAAVHPEPYDPIAVSSLLSPSIVGLGTVLAPLESGTLYLRMNDSPAELADNVGQAEVEIKAE
jgi:hypothetical protein